MAETTDVPDENPESPYYPELGQTGLRRMGEDLFEEWLPDLAGQKAVRAYREMNDNDTIVGAFMFAIKMLMRQVQWTFEPADESDEAQKWADFLTECIDDTEHTFADFVAEVFSMLPYGWSWFEIVYKKRGGLEAKKVEERSKFDDNKVGWRKFSIRSQDSLNGWVYDENSGELLGMRQLAPPKYEDKVIPLWKSCHFVTEAIKESPEGRSILRNAWIAYYRKKRIEGIEAIGIERDLAGLPMAGVDARVFSKDASPDEKALLQAAMQLVAKVRRDQQEGIVYPLAYDKQSGNPLFKFELLSTAGTRQLDVSSTITRYDQRIAMTVLADFILLGTQNVGSWALAKDKTNLFGLAISAWSEMVAQAFNRQAVARIMHLNKVKPELWPKLTPGEPQAPNLEEFANFLETVAKAGMPLFPDKALEGHVRRLAKLPEPSPEAEEAFEAEAEIKLEQQKLMVEGQKMGMQQMAMGAEEGAGDAAEGEDGGSPQDTPEEGSQGDPGANPGPSAKPEPLYSPEDDDDEED